MSFSPTVRGVDPQVYRQVGDALGGAGHPVSLVLDLLHDGQEVHELLPLAVEELPVLCGPIDQLQNQRPSRHNSRPTGKEISEKGFC